LYQWLKKIREPPLKLNKTSSYLLVPMAKKIKQEPHSKNGSFNPIAL
jgi:hypothetical protein